MRMWEKCFLFSVLSLRASQTWKVTGVSARGKVKLTVRPRDGMNSNARDQEKTKS